MKAWLPLVVAACCAYGCATRNDCGAQALASSMGPGADVQQLYLQTYTPARGGTLPSDMLGASRRHGFEPKIIDSWSTLRDQLDAGRKVIVLQNRRIEWWPQWHYAVVTGFNAAQETLDVEGEGAVKRDLFMKMWRDGRHWGIVLLPQDPATQP